MVRSTPASAGVHIRQWNFDGSLSQIGDPSKFAIGIKCPRHVVHITIRDGVCGELLISPESAIRHTQAEWLGELRAELMQFPYGRYDDQVDSLSQFLNWVSRKSRNRVTIRPLGI